MVPSSLYGLAAFASGAALDCCRSRMPSPKMREKFFVFLHAEISSHRRFRPGTSRGGGTHADARLQGQAICEDGPSRWKRDAVDGSRRLVDGARGENAVESVTLHRSLTMENAIDAAEHGALVQNYARNRRGNRRGPAAGRRPREAGAGRRGRARAARTHHRQRRGPWFDRVAADSNRRRSPASRTTKGVHIRVRVVHQAREYSWSPRSTSRAVFANPSIGHTSIGTTDTDFDDDPSTASATDEDVRYVIESLAPQLQCCAASSSTGRRPASARSCARRLAIRSQPHAPHHDRDVRPRLGARRAS